MSRLLGAIWENASGLLVEDGWLAVGALGAVALTWGFAAFAASAAEAAGGALLLVLVCALVLGNLYGAGRAIRRAHER